MSQQYVARLLGIGSQGRQTDSLPMRIVPKTGSVFGNCAVLHCASLQTAGDFSNTSE
jgi:hypothetical protein